MTQRAVVLVGILLTTLIARSQQPAGHLSFEVATIKPHDGVNSGARTQPLPGGRLRVENQSLRTLIKTAYQIQDFQLSGGPAWITSERYDIEAKAEGNPHLLDVVGPMLRSLLEDRFKLKSHREVRQMPVYVLSAAKGGIKIHPSEQGTCVPYDPNRILSKGGQGERKETFCGSIAIAKGTMSATSIRMEDLIKSISYLVGRTVTDGTNFKETFDLRLTFSRAEVTLAPSPGASDDQELPSIEAALQEQLGLSLKSARGPVEIFIIDSAEKPSAN